MKTPWTPGKWEIDSDYIVPEGWTGGKDYVAILGDRIDWRDNAALIALAPEMAEAVLSWDNDAEWRGDSAFVEWEIKMQAISTSLRRIMEETNEPN